MSFIRADSNPEAMYVYDSTGGVYISANTLVDRYENPVELCMPERDFYGLFRKWVRAGYPEAVKFRGAALAEIPSRATLQHMLAGKIFPPNAGQWRLSHTRWGRKTIVAYKVTWAYVATNVVRRSA